MKKKIIIISAIVLGIVILGLGSFYLVKHLNNKKIVLGNEDVVSVIILDINPSVKIELDKDNKVIRMIPLNDDAKDIVYDDCKGNDLDYVIYKIVNNLVDKGYTEDKITVLVSTTGNIEPIGVLETVKQEFVTKDVEADVIMQDISATASEKAKEYGISESKASFIEEMISENQELTYEDLKDKSIEELNNMKTSQENSQEDRIGDTANSGTSNNTGNSGNSGNSNSGNNNSNEDYDCNPPTDLKDSAWCEWNVKRHFNCEFDYPMKKSYQELNNLIYAHLGITNQTGAIGSPVAHKGTSYCQTYKMTIMTSDAVYTVEIDQVTGEIISSNKTVPTYKITKEQAKQKAIAYWNLKEEDINIIDAIIDLNGGPNGAYYRCQVNIMTYDGKNYSVDYNASTGEYMSSRTW